MNGASILSLPVLLLVACHAGVDCPLIDYSDGFSLVLDDPGWEPAKYAIDLSYEDRYGSHVFRCEVPVPSYARDGALDGGRSLSADAGSTSLGDFTCVVLSPTEPTAFVRAGRALELMFEGTPPSVHLAVTRDGGIPVLEQDLALNYETTYPHGRSCGGPSHARAYVPLP